MTPCLAVEHALIMGIISPRKLLSLSPRTMNTKTCALLTSSASQRALSCITLVHFPPFFVTDHSCCSAPFWRRSPTIAWRWQTSRPRCFWTWRPKRSRREPKLQLRQLPTTWWWELDPLPWTLNIKNVDCPSPRVAWEFRTPFLSVQVCYSSFG